MMLSFIGAGWATKWLFAYSFVYIMMERSPAYNITCYSITVVLSLPVIVFISLGFFGLAVDLHETPSFNFLWAPLLCLVWILCVAIAFGLGYVLTLFAFIILKALRGASEMVDR